MDDLISRCELFNRLATVKDLGKAFAGIKDEVCLLPTEKVVFKQIVDAEAVIEAEGE